MFPRILHIYGPLWINGYGLMIAIGFLLFVFLTLNQAKKKKLISPDLFLNAIFVGLIFAILGGRIFYIITDPSVLSNWIEMLYPWTGGFSVLGSIIGVLIALPIYLKKHKIAVLPFFDLLTTFAPLLQSIARIGCLLAGCCYGKIASASLPWAISFVNEFSLAPTNILLHPTQLYSSMASFLIFLILLIRTKYFSNKPGQITCTYLCLESISRFSIDFFRGDRDFVSDPFIFKSFFTIFSASQITAILIFICALIGLFYVSKKNASI